MEATATAEKARIRPNTANMVKTKGGSYFKDDFIGTTLNGLTVDQVKVIATECELDVGKYSHLNPGQQRMTLGNRLRALVAMQSEDGLEGEALDAALASNKTAEELRDRIEDMATGMKQANVEAAANAKEAKEAAKAAKAAAAKEAKAAAKAAKKAKVGDDAEGEGDAE